MRPPSLSASRGVAFPLELADSLCIEDPVEVFRVFCAPYKGPGMLEEVARMSTEPATTVVSCLLSLSSIDTGTEAKPTGILSTLTEGHANPFKIVVLSWRSLYFMMMCWFIENRLVR